MTRWMLLILLGAVLGADEPAAGPGGVAPSSASSERTWQRYEVLVQRNMFTRRSAARPAASNNRQAEAPPPPVAPGRYWIFAGTALTAGDRIAFLEDTRNSTTIRARVNDDTAAGRIVRIASDELHLEVGGRISRISLGATLAGAEPAALGSAAPVASPSGPDVPTSGASGASGGGSETDILQRMRARRMQELAR